jgi:hypothetical protein
MRAWVWSIVVALLVFTPICIALTVNPQEYRIQQVEQGRDYPVIATIINSDAVNYVLTLRLDQKSEYLADVIVIEEPDLTLSANEKKNIRFTVRPGRARLSPEEHMAVILVMAGNVKVGEFRIRMTVPGERHERLILEELMISEATLSRPLYVILSLSNQGNVIARASPMVEIFEGQKFMDRFGEESEIRIMPGERFNITLMYDTSRLVGEHYTLKASLSYGNNLVTNTLEEQISLIHANKVMNLSVEQGQSLVFPVSLQGTEPSKYRITYIIENTGITGTVEGAYTGLSDIPLEINSSGLMQGEYSLRLVIQTGQSLERTEDAKYLLTVNGGIKMSWTLLALPLALVAGAIFLWRKGFLKVFFLQLRIFLITRRYMRAEKELRLLSANLTTFIAESNSWLRTSFGGRHGFK